MTQVATRRVAIPGPIRIAIFAIVAVLAGSAAGCGSSGPSNAALVTGVDVTEAPAPPTPWPNGTVGRYGLRVDPTLLQRLPSAVGGESLVESADMEKVALDSAEPAATIESIAAATAGSYGDPDWATVQILRLRTTPTDADYATLRDQLNEGACSQAGGVESTGSETIAERKVDVATCLGEVTAYTFELDARTLISVVEMGPRQLGHQLLEAIP